MLSSASRRTDRFAAATGALLLQLAFIAAFLRAFTAEAPPKQLERELTFFLPRLLPKPAPIAPAPPTSSVPLTAPVITPPVVFSRPAPPFTTVPPAAIQNFGRALLGCAPETYFSLTPQQRTLCPPPGQGMALLNAPSLYGLPSQVKDNPHWANAMAHEQSPLLLPGASPDKFGITLMAIHDDGKISGLAATVADGSIADPENWPTYVDPAQFLPPPPLKSGSADENPDAGPK